MFIEEYDYESDSDLSYFSETEDDLGEEDDGEVHLYVTVAFKY